jgi:hypothetical protein
LVDRKLSETRVSGDVSRQTRKVTAAPRPRGISGLETVIETGSPAGVLVAVAGSELGVAVSVGMALTVGGTVVGTTVGVPEASGVGVSVPVAP